jgi:hypothetical protein
MSSLRRLNYFAGRLLSADDFAAEQAYHRAKLRRHNRLAHGSGVARGLTVSIGGPAARRAVTVKPGYGIDPAGNELELESAVCLAIAVKARAFAVVIALEDRLVDPVPVAGGGDAGDELRYSRIEEVCVVALHPDDSPRATASGLVLGRFIRGRGGWRRDPSFKLQRLRR